MRSEDLYGVRDPHDPDVVWVPVRQAAPMPPGLGGHDSSRSPVLPVIALISAVILLISSLLPLVFGLASQADARASEDDQAAAMVLTVVGAVVAGGALLILVLAIVALVVHRPRLVGWGILPGLLGLGSTALMFVPEAVFAVAFGARALLSVPASLALIICGFVALIAVAGRPGRESWPAVDYALGGMATLACLVLAAAGAGQWAAPAGAAAVPQAFASLDWLRVTVMVSAIVLAVLAALVTWRRRTRLLGWLVPAGLFAAVVAGLFLLGTEMEAATVSTIALRTALAVAAALVCLGFVALARPRRRPTAG